MRSDRNRLESSIQKAVIAYARSRGFICIKQNTAGARGVAGWPDYLLIPPGTGEACFMEFKRAGGSLSPLQAQRIAELAKWTLCRVWVVDNVHLGKTIIDRVLK